jgi:hypothetical protein
LSKGHTYSNFIQRTGDPDCQQTYNPEDLMENKIKKLWLTVQPALEQVKWNVTTAADLKDYISKYFFMPTVALI